MAYRHPMLPGVCYGCRSPPAPSPPLFFFEFISPPFLLPPPSFSAGAVYSARRGSNARGPGVDCGRLCTRRDQRPNPALKTEIPAADTRPKPDPQFPRCAVFWKLKYLSAAVSRKERADPLPAVLFSACVCPAAPARLCLLNPLAGWVRSGTELPLLAATAAATCLHWIGPRSPRGFPMRHSPLVLPSRTPSAPRAEMCGRCFSA